MDGAFVTSLLVLTGICAYAALRHVSAAWRQPRNATHLLFAGMCLLAVLFGLSQVQAYRAETLADLIVALKWNISFIALLFIVFPWFVAEFAGLRLRSWRIGSSILFAGLFLVNLYQPYSLQFEVLTGLEPLHLPWGETITHPVGRPGLWFGVAVLLVLLNIGFALYVLLAAYRRDRARATLAMVFAVSVYLLTAIEGILVRASIIDFVHLGPYGILVMVAVMSAVLSHETVQRLRDSERRFRSLVEQSPFSIQVLSPTGRTRQVNAAWEQLWGVNAGSLGDYNILHDRQLLDKGVMPAIEAGFAGKATELPPIIYNPADNPIVPGPVRDRWVRAYIYPIKDEVGVIRDVILMHEDVTEKKLAEDTIWRMAYRDYLTDLANRALLQERLTEVLARVRRSRESGALLLIDLDHFKTINDALSHDVGDDVLRAVGRRLAEVADDQALVARLGGDEFAVLMDNGPAIMPTAERAVHALAQKILDKLSSPILLGERVFSLGASIGVVLFPENGESELDILRHAEMALYRAKGLGRGNIQFYVPSLQAAAATRLQLEEGLRRVIANDELALYFQPQLDAGGRVIGAEALLRWRHPELGEIPPATFIPVAEETGLIHAIGRWVFDRACSQLNAWLRAGVPFEGHLSINVCPWQFARPDFVQLVSECLAQHQIDPDLLMLELTETALLYDLEGTVRKLETLRALGLHIALDDFGTGYSSLAYLKDLPLDQIKIDKAFIAELDRSKEHTLVETMIAIGRHMRLGIIAEGVESEVQNDILRELGCDGFQGFLYCRPLPEREFLEWLSERVSQDSGIHIPSTIASNRVEPEPDMQSSAGVVAIKHPHE